jgi:hypothetical protein
MAIAQHSFTINAGNDTVWLLLSDFTKWSQFFVMEQPQTKGWGSNFAIREGSGVGAKLDMFWDQKLMQVWEVEVWTPRRQLRIASKSCHDIFFKDMKSSIEISLKTVGDQKTQIDATFESQFTNPFFGPIFNSLVPLQGELRKILARMEESLQVLLTTP